MPNKIVGKTGKRGVPEDSSHFKQEEVVNHVKFLLRS